MIFHLGPGCMLFPFQVQVKQLKYLQEEWFVSFFCFPFNGHEILVFLIRILPKFFDCIGFHQCYLKSFYCKHLVL